MAYPDADGRHRCNNGGCNRQALTDCDQQGRELFLQWCRASGYAVRDDAIGNIFVRRAGENGQCDDGADSLPMAMGSHLDTQPTGGRFDGVLGVLAVWRYYAVWTTTKLLPSRRWK